MQPVTTGAGHAHEAVVARTEQASNVNGNNVIVLPDSSLSEAAHGARSVLNQRIQPKPPRRCTSAL